MSNDASNNEMPNEPDRLRSIGSRLEEIREHLAVIKGEVMAIEQQVDELLDVLADVVSPGWRRSAE